MMDSKKEEDMMDDKPKEEDPEEKDMGDYGKDVYHLG